MRGVHLLLQDEYRRTLFSTHISKSDLINHSARRHEVTLTLTPHKSRADVSVSHISNKPFKAIFQGKVCLELAYVEESPVTTPKRAQLDPSSGIGQSELSSEELSCAQVKRQLRIRSVFISAVGYRTKNRLHISQNEPNLCAGVCAYLHIIYVRFSSAISCAVLLPSDNILYSDITRR